MTSVPTTTTTSPRAPEQEDPRDRYRSWPALSYHFGLSWDEIRRMPRWLRRIYTEELPRLRAQQMSEAIDAACFPNMEGGAQRRVLRRISRALGEEPHKPETETGAKEAAASIGIGTKFVPGADGDG